MKTKEELNALKAEYETMNNKLAELTEEELEQVSGGMKQHLLPKEFPIDEILSSDPMFFRFKD